MGNRVGVAVGAKVGKGKGVAIIADVGYGVGRIEDVGAGIGVGEGDDVVMGDVPDAELAFNQSGSIRSVISLDIVVCIP